MTEQLQHSAEQVRAGLSEDLFKGSQELAAFIQKYAPAGNLHHRVIISRMRLHQQADEAGSLPLRQTLLEILEEALAQAEITQKEQGTASQADKRELLRKKSRLSAEQKEVVLSATGITKSFKRSGFSLKGIDLTIRLGEITSVVGENGNGKTTLFRILAGELAQDVGQLSYPLFEADPPRRWRNWRKIRHEIAYVPQELPKWQGSLLQGLQFEAAIHGIKGKDNDRAVEFIVYRLGLQDHLNLKWSELSGGFKLRFALAKALIWNPKLLIIDEPLANLDFKTQLVVLNDLRNLTHSFRYPMGVILSSQHLHEIEAVSDQILFLRRGEVKFYGSMKDIGTERNENTFEFSCPLELKAIKENLTGLAYKSIYHNGLAYVLTTPTEVDATAVLRYLVQKGVQVSYFRDLSQTVKQLFS